MEGGSNTQLKVSELQYAVGVVLCYNERFIWLLISLGHVLNLLNGYTTFQWSKLRFSDRKHGP